MPPLAVILVAHACLAARPDVAAEFMAQTKVVAEDAKALDTAWYRAPGTIAKATDGTPSVVVRRSTVKGAIQNESLSFEVVFLGSKGTPLKATISDLAAKAKSTGRQRRAVGLQYETDCQGSLRSDGGTGRLGGWIAPSRLL